MSTEEQIKLEERRQASPTKALSPAQQRRKEHLDRIRNHPLCSNPVSKWLRNSENLQVIITISSVLLAITVGLSIRLNVKERLESSTIRYIGFPGEVLMNMLKMLIIPLIICSLVSGLANLDIRSSGKIGSYSMIYYFSTTLFAVILGIILVVSIHPGSVEARGSAAEGKSNPIGTVSSVDTFMDLVRNIFPDNIIQAATHQKQTKYANVTKDGETKEMYSLQNVASTNVLGIVTFSIAFGLCISAMGERGKPMVTFFLICNEIVMKIVAVIMWYAPIGIFFLILGKILEVESLEKVVAGLGKYMLTVILGLFIHLLFTLFLIYYATTRKNPLVFMKGIFRAALTGLAIGSSSATLPVTFACLEENLNIDSRVTRFVLPIGATINMDGTALYEAVASIFIAQVNGISLPFSKLIIISFTATLAAIGAASVPSAGLVTMMLVLTSVGLPTQDVVLIVAVDWLLDRIRTSINIIGDAFGAGIVAHLVRDDLAAMNNEERNNEEDSKEITYDKKELEEIHV